MLVFNLKKDAHSGRHFDEGLQAFNTTSFLFRLLSKVSPELWTGRAWALLHHLGILTYPHHDVDATTTFIRVRRGCKLWSLLRLKPNRELEATSYSNLLKKYYDLMDRNEEEVVDFQRDFKDRAIDKYEDVAEVHTAHLESGDLL